MGLSRPLAGLPAGHEQALHDLGRYLQACGYRFATPTPATIARVNARPENAAARDLGGAFGWNRRFSPELLPTELGAALLAAGLVATAESGWRSRLRASTVGERLYFHSAFPTEAADSVFFGPDSYRFVDLIAAELAQLTAPPRRALDIGCGSGVGGIEAAVRLGCAAEMLLSDINPAALGLARINAALAGCPVRLVASDLLTAIGGRFDLILANPPYMMDARHRAYRDGGGLGGAGLSLRIVEQALPRLAEGGRLLLYTGAAIADGRDPLREALSPLLTRAGVHYSYRELDPDVFGEELEEPAYRAVERIAVIALTVTK